jgi:hypothetical protein
MKRVFNKYIGILKRTTDALEMKNSTNQIKIQLKASLAK